MEKQRKMKILQICNFSSGISGVWTRALEDGKEFIKRGHDVHVFSSDEEENGLKVLANEDIIEGIKVKRFPVKRKKGYALWFDFDKEMSELKPDIIICHGLRKPYLGPASKISKEIGAKCFLVTHAPFIPKELRNYSLRLAIWFYDTFIGKKIMNSFDKVVAICKWEKKNLIELGCDENRIIYIPNSLDDAFFLKERIVGEKKVIFMGRMHPVKNIEILIESFKNSNLNDYILEIVSSKEGEYYNSLLNLKNEKVIFTEPIYDLDKKIEKLDSSEIFVLPSKKESLPFGIIEAMARGKIVVTTRTLGGEELIERGENGFLVEINDEKDLISILNLIKEMPKHLIDEIKNKAIKKAEEFKVTNVMEKWENLFNDKR